MAVTVLQRKGRRNKTRARVKKQVRKLANAVVTVASPYKDISGIIIDDNAAPVVVAVEQEISAEDQAAAEAVLVENQGGTAEANTEAKAKSDEAPAEEEKTEDKE